MSDVTTAYEGLYLPVAPQVDPAFMASYRSVEDALIQDDRSELGTLATLVAQAHEAGLLTDASLAGLTDDAKGRLHLAHLAKAAIDAVAGQACARARALVQSAGLSLPDESWLIYVLHSPRFNPANRLTLDLARGDNCRIYGLSRFFTDDMPDLVRDLAHVALFRATYVAPGACHAGVMHDQDEAHREFMIEGIDPVLHDLFDHWDRSEATPCFDTACATLREHLGDEAEAAIEQCRDCWDDLSLTATHYAPALRGGAATRSDLDALIEQAQHAGLAHPVLDYARAVSRIETAVQPLIARFDANEVAAEAMNSNFMLMVITHDNEWGYAQDNADMMMQGEESGVSLETPRAGDFDALIEALSLFYVQALTLEAAGDMYRLTVPWNDSFETTQHSNRAA